MIPVIYFEENTEYTVVANNYIVKGTYKGSSSGKLTFADAVVYTASMERKNAVSEIVLDFSDIISVGQCSEKRYIARNDFCWKLNDATIEQKTTER